MRKRKFKEMFAEMFLKERNMIVASVCVGLAVSLLYCGYSAYAYSKEVNADLKEVFVRFHVVANSDSVEDQSLKLRVRDVVLERYSEKLCELGSKNEAEEFFRANMGQIQSLAQQEVIHNGYDYTVKVSLEETFFPTKYYEGFSLPAGNYEALKIIIGNGEGKNWWCVMFPPLCYVDVSHSDVEDKLKGILDEDEYNVVMSNENKEPQYKIKFKVVEWFQSLTKDKELSGN